MALAAARANTNAIEHTGEVIDVTGIVVVRMDGSQFDFDLKAVVFTAPTAGAPAEALDIYGQAGVNAAQALVSQLGSGPYPEALPFLIETVPTKRGERATLVPHF